MLIGTWLKYKGYEVELINQELYRYSTEEVLRKIEEFNADIVGFSSIVVTSYGVVKELSIAIKTKFPKIFLIAGGQIAHIPDLLFAHTPIDAVVVGEGEITVIELLDAWKSGSDFGEVNGISYRKDGKVVSTAPRKLIDNLDMLPLPNYDLIDMDSYLKYPIERFDLFLPSIRKIGDWFDEPHRQGQKAFSIFTGRGCYANCSFCSRSYKGVRKFSASYVLKIIKLLKEKYNVGYFTFIDDCFIPNKKWVYEFIDKLSESKLDILFFIRGARVDSVDMELLKALRSVGCFFIEYGIESGSQRMLDMMEKRVTVAENRRVLEWTREAGLHTVPGLVINLPGETTETINESIEFMKSLMMDPPQYYINYAVAYPNTPLYEYAMLMGMIKDEEDYLTKLEAIGHGETNTLVSRNLFLNFSELPIEEVMSWQSRIGFDIEIDYLKRKHGKAYPVIIFRRYLSKGFSERVRKIFSGGMTMGINTVMKRLSVLTSVLSKGGISNSAGLEKSTHSSVNFSEGDDILYKIKTGKFTTRRSEKHPTVKDLDVYIDDYDGRTVVRYPSLRQLNMKIKQSPGE
jgi:radical SAM superfamily enzyme YgiQ (UPF0313 family)